MHIITTTRSSASTSLAQSAQLEQRTLQSLIVEFLRSKKSTETKKAYQKDITVFFAALSLVTA